MTRRTVLCAWSSALLALALLTAGSDGGSCIPTEPQEPRECAPEECGPQLGMPNYLCEDGETVAGPTGRCLRADDGSCGWEIATCPEDEACTDEECGPPPMAPAYECPDGSMGGNTGRCLRDEDGVCGWEFRECP